MQTAVHAVSFHHGDHICLFYQDVEEQMAVAVPFVEIGLLRGERCLCVLTRPQAELLCAALETEGLSPKEEMARGALLLRTPEEAYLSGGNFDRHAMVKQLDDAMRESLALGFTGFRGTGDLSWAAHDTGACGQLPEYEAMLDRYFPGKQSLGICMYDMRLFSAEEITQLMKVHRLAILHPSETRRAIRMRKGRVFGDVLFDRLQKTSIFHFVVQEEDSAKVLMSGQDSSLTGAIKAVESALAGRASYF
jgi:MEDS: MEthanogen/methylotroph, DcmR Sensory domain